MSKRTSRVCICVLASVASLACQGGSDQSPIFGTNGGSSSGASASGGSSAAMNGGASSLGGASTSNGGASAAGASARAGSANGGSAAGGPTTSGGAAVGGGAAGRGAGGAAGRASTGGTTGAQGGASMAGANSNAGAAGCVQNLGCMLTAPPSSGDVYQDCVDRVNQFRTQCACLPPLARWSDGEACANQDAEYDSSQPTAHAGFIANICNAGQSEDECPGWGSDAQVISGCLQQMWNEGPPPQNPCTGTCYQDHGHFINMTSTTVTKVACGFFTTSAGKVWAVQNFSR